MSNEPEPTANPTHHPAIEVNTVFEKATFLPCPSCVKLAFNDKIPRDAVMPLAIYGPRSYEYDRGESICFDCASAEDMGKLKVMGAMPFHARRLTIANERLESLRMPMGMAQHMGMMSQRMMRTAHLGQLKPHIKWLVSIGMRPVPFLDRPAPARKPRK